MAHKAPVRFVPEADAEFEGSRAWYEGRRAGLGEEFVDAGLACLDRIRESPKLYARYKEEYRRASVRRFPYGIYYEFENGVVVVYAVFHESQDPVKLDRRLL
ncbi:MAG TPA: type II toxin-antitoxin system RelE/ParE family toxin [Pirellulaceae bacterium]|nr:type II toxin-antitoxin system RelE/ParE family toxin [Pirellulaceae bacterium]